MAVFHSRTVQAEAILSSTTMRLSVNAVSIIPPQHPHRSLVAGTKRRRTEEADDRSGPSKRCRPTESTLRGIIKKTSSKDKKSVSFAPKVHVRLVHHIHPVDHPYVWFTAWEMDVQRHQDLALFHAYSNHDPFMNNLLELVGMSCRRAQQEQPEQDEQDMDMAPAYHVSDSPVRGLERDIVPCFRTRRKHVIQRVLETSRTLQKWRAKKEDHVDKSTDFCANVLAAQYGKLARPSAMFARLVGQGDALVVEEEDASSSTTTETANTTGSEDEGDIVD